MIERARAAAGDLVQLEFVVGDALALPFEDGALRRRHDRLRAAQPGRLRGRLPRAGAGRPPGRPGRLPRAVGAAAAALGSDLPRRVPRGSPPLAASVFGHGATYRYLPTSLDGFPDAGHARGHDGAGRAGRGDIPAAGARRRRPPRRGGAGPDRARGPPPVGPRRRSRPGRGQSSSAGRAGGRARDRIRPPPRSSGPAGRPSHRDRSVERPAARADPPPRRRRRRPIAEPLGVVVVGPHVGEDQVDERSADDDPEDEEPPLELGVHAGRLAGTGGGLIAPKYMDDGRESSRAVPAAAGSRIDRSTLRDMIDFTPDPIAIQLGAAAGLLVRDLLRRRAVRRLPGDGARGPPQGARRRDHHQRPDHRGDRRPHRRAALPRRRPVGPVQGRPDHDPPADPPAADGAYFFAGFSGLGVYGGLITGTIAALAYIRWKHQSFWRWADVVAPALFVMQAIGRLGQLLQPGALRPADEPAVGDRHPVQEPGRRLRLSAGLRSRRDPRRPLPPALPVRVAVRPARRGCSSCGSAAVTRTGSDRATSCSIFFIWYSVDPLPPRVPPLGLQLDRRAASRPPRSSPGRRSSGPRAILVIRHLPGGPTVAEIDAAEAAERSADGRRRFARSRRSGRGPRRGRRHARRRRHAPRRRHADRAGPPPDAASSALDPPDPRPIQPNPRPTQPDRRPRPGRPDGGDGCAVAPATSAPPPGRIAPEALAGRARWRRRGARLARPAAGARGPASSSGRSRSSPGSSSSGSSASGSRSTAGSSLPRTGGLHRGRGRPPWLDGPVRRPARPAARAAGLVPRFGAVGLRAALARGAPPSDRWADAGLAGRRRDRQARRSGPGRPRQRRRLRPDAGGHGQRAARPDRHRSGSGRR